ncbi:VOC family protein [Halomonas sp. BL6]|uniref:VOC family protein n=1 Tax=Halomonas sp. BL6 TaxID=2585770 RepID=UPI00111B6587|nr:VOC family protein [Halomonas sp. BL6]TNH14112.1 glyoxalase [Halomonas sp. BL6]
MDRYVQHHSFPISGLRAVELSVPDINKAKDFYTTVWGLSLAGEVDGRLYLRGRGCAPYLLSLSKGPVAVESVIWEAADDTDLAALRQRMIDAGGSDATRVAEVDRLGGGTGFTLRDPAGRRISIVQGGERAEPQEGKSLPTHLAHVNINTSDMHRDIAFYEQGMGFELTDQSKIMSFLRTNTDHHMIVLADAEVDTLNHISFMQETWEEVMTASGKMCDAGFPIGWGPGRHGPGDNVFAYFVDPFGIVIEHTAEVLKVDESYRIGGPEDWVWPKGRTDQWGIAPPKTETCKKAQLAIPFS